MQEETDRIGSVTKALNIRELSKITGVSLSTLNRLKTAGKLPHHRIGGRIVFTTGDVDDFFSSCKVNEREGK